MQKGIPTLTVWMVSLFLLLAPVSPQCRTGTAQECQMVFQFIPGLKSGVNGIDITKLDISFTELMDLSKWENANGGCTLCDNPLLKKVQKLPVAITNWRANISCQQKGQRLVLQSEVSVADAFTKLTVKNDWTTDLHVDVNSSANFDRALAGACSFFTTISKDSALKDKFSIDKDKAVGDHFKSEVRALSVNYDDVSKLDYFTLIVKYGTHFITEYDFGASMRIFTAVPVCKIHLDNFTVSQVDKCLEIQLDYLISPDKGTKKQELQKCNNTLQYLKLLTGSNIHLIDIIGGSFYTSGDMVNGIWNQYEKWLESVKSEPGLSSFSVQAIHTLVDPNDPRRRNLQLAVSDYVTQNALFRRCTHPCPPGIKQRDPCSCECPNDNYTNSMCCPQKPGLARLTVNIINAKRLWGDFFSATDAYVKVFYKGKVMCTPTIWNINEPIWNISLDFGIIQITENYPQIKIQVWDDDGGLNDDLLGKCSVSLESWNSVRNVCYLNHRGRMYFKYHLACAQYLGGPVCTDYYRHIKIVEKKIS